jgi:hypothetical protein
MQTIVFLTLFLGLVEGPQVVELAATGETARVEVLVDGELQAAIDGGPPWRAAIDLGDELAPRRLEAVARDAAGDELGRAEQWLNLPRARAEVTLLVDRTDAGAVARIAWRAVEHLRAESVEVKVDDRPAPVPGAGPFEAPLEVALPPLAADGGLHLVTAEVIFPDGSSARADAAVGGPFGETVVSELTGVAVAVDRQRRLRDVRQAGEWLRVDGEAHRPVALDHGAATLYAVVDAGARHDLALLRSRMDVHAEPRVESFTPGPRSRLSRPRPGRVRGAGLEAGDRLHLVRPQVDDDRPGRQLFAASEPLDAGDGGTAWQLTHRRLPADPDRPQRLADAAAAAGMRASGSSRPRGVVLVLGPGARDHGVLDPAELRRYLRRLRVPLRVWYLDVGGVEVYARGDAALWREGESRSRRRARHLAEARAHWGEVVEVSTLQDWLTAADRLREELAHQRILWIEGRHPPQAVTLDGAPGWLRLVGGGAASPEAGR